MLTPQILLLTAAIASLGANSLMLSPISGAVSTSFDGYGAADIMWASAAYGIGTAISALMLAPLADRLGAGLVLRTGLGVLALAFSICAIAPNLPVLIIAQALGGVAAGAVLPSIYSVAAAVAPKGRESEALGVVLTGWTISMVLGVGLASVVADLWHWRAIFTCLALFAAAISWALHNQTSKPLTAGRATSPLTALAVPGIMPMLLICVAYMMAFYGTYTYLGAHLIEVLHVTTMSAGTASIAYGIGFGAAVPFDRLIDRFGDAKSSPPVFGALALAYAGIALSIGQYWIILGICFAWGLFNHLALNLIVKQLGALDPSQRGAIMGLYSAITYFCVALAAIFFRPVLDLFGLAVCAWLSAIFVAFAFVMTVHKRSAA